MWVNLYDLFEKNIFDSNGVEVEIVSNLKGHSFSWISVSDRLPTDRRDYLLTDGEHCYVGHYRPDAKAWDHWILGWVQQCCADGSVEDVNITHWMPLPELPTDERSEPNA